MVTNEPKLLDCAERVSDDDFNHIECRFSDGQKFAAILVDKEFPELRKLIVSLLVEHIESRP